MSVNAFDLAAEQSLLGSVLAAADVAGPALMSVPVQAWWDGKHADIAAILSEMLTRGEGVDPTTVLTRLGERGKKMDGPYLLTLIQRAWQPGNAGMYADRIRELYARRYLAAKAIETAQKLDAEWEAGLRDGHLAEIPVAVAVKELREACATAEMSSASENLPTPETLADLLVGQDAYDWLVPGLMERMERWVLTGSEGTGKSVLIAQFMTAVAAGVHPFTGDVLESGPVRVLVVDCENPRPASRRRYRWMVSVMDKARDFNGMDPVDWPKQQMHVELRPGGVDLLRGPEAAWLEHAVSSTSPDIVAIGPLYRLHRSDPSDERAARDLVSVLDGIRERYQVALVTEAHAGHAEDSRGGRKMRPSGSSLWLRWPEFGYGLRRSKDDPGYEHPEYVDMVAWRGSREERNWPRVLQHGKLSATPLPWKPANPDYYDNPTWS